MKTRLLSSLTFLLLVTLSCDQPFSFTPFDATIPESSRNTTARNLERILAHHVDGDTTVQVALISDTHYHFNDLADAISDINANPAVDFVVVTGDLTENGLQKEYLLFHDQMSSCNKPYVTVIGNHDYLSNGAVLYQQMFGPLNYSFAFGHVKFVMWDNVLWESNKTPDWDWFATALGTDSDNEQVSGTSVVIPFSHIPPMDGQLADSAEVFHTLLHSHDVSVSIHGHRHEYMNEGLRGPDVRYVTVGSPQKRAYAMLTVIGKQIVVEQVKF